MSDDNNLNDDLRDTLKDVKNEAEKTASEFANGAKDTLDSVTGDNKRVLAGLLGIFFGGLGLHKFVLGYTKEGIIQLVATMVTCGAASIIGFIEGVIYLSKSDEEFYITYQLGKKPWF